MAIRIRLMSWNIQKKTTNAPFIARVMRDYEIDICALLEVPNSAADTIPQRILAELNNLNPPYHAGEWRFESVEVGDECVTYLWHEAAAVGPNAFRASTYANSHDYIAGKVLRNATGQPIYFPNTPTSWSSLPGKFNGRRPSYFAFETNDNAPARRFTFLDIHTPFNPDTLIQSYSTHLYASSREIRTVDTLDVSAAARDAEWDAINGAPATVDELNDPSKWLDMRTAAVEAVIEYITVRHFEEAVSLTELFRSSLTVAISAALASVAIPPSCAPAYGNALARACTRASVMSATHLVSSIALPTAPLFATTEAAAQAAVTTALGNLQYTQNVILRPPALKKQVAKAVLAAVNTLAYTYPAVPGAAVVNSSIMAGDFNVDYPDTTVYLPSSAQKLGGGQAYGSLALVSGGNATINAKTTRIGPTAFESQRLYSLIPPSSPAASMVVGNLLDLNSLQNVNFIGNNAWSNRLRTLATAQNIQWTDVEKIGQDVYVSFDSVSAINDTSFYRANAYDNIFVRNATVLRGACIDVISELGSWPLPPNPIANPFPSTALNPNPWPAALGRLNDLAVTQLSAPDANLTFAYNTLTTTVTYVITPQLGDAEQAAVFFDKFISDHLPVFVEVEM